jgi:hypothetical protein
MPEIIGGFAGRNDRCPRRQLAKRRVAARLDCLANSATLVCRQVVDRDNILTFERRRKTLFDTGQEFLARHRVVDGLRRSHLPVACGT